MLTEHQPESSQVAESGPRHARVITSFAELESLRGTWQALCDQTPRATFFQSWPWFATWWQHFQDGQQLRVVLVEDCCEQPIGLVPLVIRHDPSGLRWRRLMYPLDNWGTVYGPLGAEPACLLPPAMAAVTARSRDWDLLDLRWVPEDHSPALSTALQSAGFRGRPQLWGHTGQIDLRGGWESYWSSRSSKFRNNRRRSEQLLHSLGAVRYVHFAPATGETDMRWDLYEACERVAEASWQGTSEAGTTLCHPRTCTFLRAVHVEAVRAGLLSLSLLFVNDEPAAFTYNYCSHGTVHGLRMGYVPRYREASPGAAVLLETIREACRRGDHSFDLGEGESAYKHHWETQAIATYRFRQLCLTNSLRRWFDSSRLPTC